MNGCQLGVQAQGKRRTGPDQTGPDQTRPEQPEWISDLNASFPTGVTTRHDKVRVFLSGAR